MFEAGTSSGRLASESTMIVLLALLEMLNDVLCISRSATTLVTTNLTTVDALDIHIYRPGCMTRMLFLLVVESPPKLFVHDY